MDKLSSCQILTRIFIYSQNPQVHLVNRNFYEISTLNSFRTNFLIHKLGKENVFKISNYGEEFDLYPNLFKKQELVFSLLKKGAIPDSETIHDLFQIALDRGWIEVIEYLLNLFYETTEQGSLNINYENCNNIPKPKQKDMKRLHPRISLNAYLKFFIQYAISGGNVEIVEMLLNAHKIFSKKDIDFPNHKFVNHPKILLIDLDSKELCDLLEKGGIGLLELFLVNELNTYSVDNSIFSEFCKRGNMKFVKFLDKNGADIDENNGAPLKFAIENNHLDVVKYLIGRGADTTICRDLDSFLNSQNIHPTFANTINNEKQTTEDAKVYTLQEASSNGYLDIVKYLVKSGVNIHENNEIALKEASENGYLDVVKYLVEKGADIHADQDWALGMASKSGYLDIVEYLVEKGAKVQARENFALGIACWNKRLDIAKYLIENGADIIAETHWKQIFKDKNTHLDVVNYLLERGLYFSKPYSILGVVSSKGNLEFVKYLVENGADIRTNNDVAFRSASLNGHLDVVKYLVDNGADIHANNDSALRLAAKYGYLDVVKYLVQSGADIHANGDIDLREASVNRRSEVVKYLIENGADIHAEVIAL
ncbi:hypothetical protein BB559_005283 [Furculomyces boomerangus]|uniref:Uncharacterized protein n=1 Tax=Furculomyces boomerangus TaxID=61424 RepID=A0A2T9Y9G7_9FUNG|nr:hypothetical protein BB559_005283 [Furculomyces boomerangus]